MKPGCTHKCRRNRKCIDNFPEPQRQEINEYFWSLNFTDRKSFILERVKRQDIKRRRRVTEAGDNIKKKFSLSYTLMTINSQIIEVCKCFFLGTLGFLEKK